MLDTRISNVSRPNDLEMQQILLDFYTSFAIEGYVTLNFYFFFNYLNLLFKYILNTNFKIQ